MVLRKAEGKLSEQKEKESLTTTQMSPLLYRAATSKEA